MSRYKSTAFHCYLDQEKVWEYIVMGQYEKIDELYPPHFLIDEVEEQNIEKLKLVLYPNEKYSFENHDYAITSIGRVYNCKHNRFVTPKFFKDDIMILIRNKKIDFSKYFETMGWEFDFDEILDRYKTNNWKYALSNVK